MINFNSPLWLKFAPRKRQTAGGKPNMLVALVSHSPVKFKVIERKQFFSGITTRVDSRNFWMFEEYGPAIGYVNMRLKKFDEANGEELRKEKRSPLEVMQLGFTIEYIYE